MERREFLKKSSLLLGTLPLAGTLRGSDAQTPAVSPKEVATPVAATIASPPVLQNPSGDGLTVVWAVSGPSAGWVEYGETQALGNKGFGSAEGLKPYDDKVIKIRLSGLKPATAYFYRVVHCPVDFENAYKIVRGQETSGPIYQFTTLDPTAHATSFSLINDTHETKETVTRLVSMIQSQPTDTLIWDGDIFNSIPNEESIVNQVLNPFGLAYATNIPLVLVKGNHDVRGAHARALDRYCDVPGGSWYYIHRQGPIAFIILDTGEDKPDTHPVYGGLSDFDSYRSTQQEWLRHAIQQPVFRDAPFRVALLHIPLLWKDYKTVGKFCSDGKSKWHDLFVQGKLDIIISGHTHESAWFAPGEQAPYAQLIGGGPHPEIATLIRGRADKDTMNITMCDLDGKELMLHQFKRQA